MMVLVRNTTKKLLGGLAPGEEGEVSLSMASNYWKYLERVETDVGDTEPGPVGPVERGVASPDKPTKRKYNSRTKRKTPAREAPA